jgi:Cu+-exporting ATPase
MSIISGIVSSVLERTKLAALGNVELPLTDDEPLAVAKVDDSGLGKCELRIEGMTCGACVEVSPCHADALYMYSLVVVHRRHA